MANPEEYGELDEELNEAFEKEGRGAVEEEVKGEIMDNEHRLGDVRNAMRVLEFYGGNGLADGMPLGEAVGFLSAELEKQEPEMDARAIERARDFLVNLNPGEYSPGTELGALMKRFSKEEGELLRSEKADI